MTSPFLRGVKVGRWGGTKPELYSSYRTALGCDLEVTLWPCDDMVVTEKMLHTFLGEYHISSKVYDVECLDLLFGWCCTTCPEGAS